MRVEAARVLSGEQIRQAWELYVSGLGALRTRAVQRHVMHRREFDEVMTDGRVSKYLATTGTDDHLVGLSTFTNDLDAMPLISPEYFAYRWPELYQQRRVWYLGFFVVEPTHRGSGIFEEVIDRMWAEVRERGGLAALDVCGFNESLGLPAAIRRTLESITPQVATEQVDVQSYWTFGLPVIG